MPFLTATAHGAFANLFERQTGETGETIKAEIVDVSLMLLIRGKLEERRFCCWWVLMCAAMGSRGYAATQVMAAHATCLCFWGCLALWKGWSGLHPVATHVHEDNACLTWSQCGNFWLWKNESFDWCCLHNFHLFSLGLALLYHCSVTCRLRAAGSNVKKDWQGAWGAMLPLCCKILATCCSGCHGSWLTRLWVSQPPLYCVQEQARQMAEDTLKSLPEEAVAV